jgi:hypothetical protein
MCARAGVARGATVLDLGLRPARRARGSRERGRAGKDAGFVVESHRAYVVHYPPEIGYGIPRVALHSLRPVLAQHDLATDDEIARLDREIEDAKRRTDVQWVSGPLMFEWTARLHA